MVGEVGVKMIIQSMEEDWGKENKGSSFSNL